MIGRCLRVWAILVAVYAVACSIATAQVDFDGSNDYLNASYTDEFDFTREDSFSFGLWVNPDVVNNSGAMIYHRNGAGAGWTLEFQGTAGDVGTYFVDSGASLAYRVKNGIVSTDSWQHIFVVHAASNDITIYYNGQAQTADAVGNLTPNSTSYASSSDFHVGADRVRTSQYFNGTIDDVRVYNRALSANEVASIYNGRLKGSAAGVQNGLITQWSLSGNGVDRVGGITTTNNGGTYVGTILSEG